MDALTAITTPRLLVVTGKGGVGKTSVAVTLARVLEDAGRRVLLLEVDPRENAHRMLGISPSGGAVERVSARLRLQNLPPQRVLDQLVAERLPLEMLSRRVLASPVYQHFSAGAPGLKELAILGHGLRAVRGLSPDLPEVDSVVLDAPATGHGLALLRAPRLVSEVIRGGPFGRLAGELAAFVADSRSCGVVLVSTAEEMPVQETLELLAGLEEELSRPPSLVVLNALYPQPPAGVTTPRDEVWRRRFAVQERERGRLLDAWRGPLTELPLLPTDSGPELVSGLLHAWREGPP